jgi:hypothetical protein
MSCLYAEAKTGNACWNFEARLCNGRESKAQRGETKAQRGETKVQRGETKAQRGETKAQRGETEAQLGGGEHVCSLQWFPQIPYSFTLAFETLFARNA